MATFAFEIFEHGNPVLLEPLTCKKPALELELAAGTLESTLLSRWSAIQNAAPARISASRPTSGRPRPCSKRRPPRSRTANPSP